MGEDSVKTKIICAYFLRLFMQNFSKGRFSAGQGTIVRVNALSSPCVAQWGFASIVSDRGCTRCASESS